MNGMYLLERRLSAQFQHPALMLTILMTRVVSESLSFLPGIHFTLISYAKIDLGLVGSFR